MKRILTTTLAVSVLVLPACKGGASADAVKLVPNEAEFIIGLSPKAIGESELYKSFAPEFEKESDYKEMVSIFEDCGLKPFEFDAVVVGANQGGEFVAVIAGNSVGKKDEAVCVIKNVQKQAGDEQIADVVKEGGKNVINFTDGRAYLVNDNMLALATTDWQDAVGELIDGKGTPAIENSKKDAMGKVDTKKAVWFVASVPAELAGMAALAGPEVTEVKSVAGSLDLSKGVSLEFVAGFEGDDKAKAAADKVQSLFDMAKGETPAELKGMTESVKIEASGSDVKISASASMDDINAMKSQLPL
ncbi:MAG TPA: hypothetical protein VK034_09310 [Enhygromyxa sp.]|nr:hypothetical protein [Enhygromyxa sp.]